MKLYILLKIIAGILIFVCVIFILKNLYQHFYQYLQNNNSNIIKINTKNVQNLDTKNSIKSSTQNVDSSKYMILISAQCNFYQDWQVVGAVWSANKNWPGVNVIRLLNCDKNACKNYKYTNIVPTQIVSDYSTHPVTGDYYPPYNRPVAIKEMLEANLNINNTTTPHIIVILDPDVIIRKPMNDIPVSAGNPVAQRYDYLHNKNGLKVLGEHFGIDSNLLQPLGMPILIYPEDLARISTAWLYYTEQIRQDPKLNELSGWVAEMHGYCLAAAHTKLKHTVLDNLADRTPYDTVNDPYVLHYDLTHECENFKWDKRDYMNKDLLESSFSFPIPQNPPNSRFLEIFDSLNQALK